MVSELTKTPLDSPQSRYRALQCPNLVPGPTGRIVNIASVSGKDGNAGMCAYSTSKAAVIGMTKVRDDHSHSHKQ